MGRGESDILYNPPKIYKKEPYSVSPSSEKFRFLRFPQSITATDKGIVSLQLSNDGPTETVTLNTPEGMAPGWFALNNTPFSLTSEGFLWAKENTLYFKPCEELHQEAEIYPLEEEGEIWGVHAGKNTLHALVHDGIRAHLLSVDRKFTGKALQGLEHHLQSGSVYMENKGDKSIILSFGKEVSLTTISQDGLGRSYQLPHQIASSLQYWRGSFEPFLTPGQDDGTYFYFNHNKLMYLDLARERSTTIMELGQDLDLEKGVSLQSSDDKALLLASGKIFLCSKEKLLSEIDLTKTEGGLFGGFKNISFAKDMAIVWSREKRDYLQFDLKNQ